MRKLYLLLLALLFCSLTPPNLWAETVVVTIGETNVDQTGNPYKAAAKEYEFQSTPTTVKLVGTSNLTCTETSVSTGSSTTKYGMGLASGASKVGNNYQNSITFSLGNGKIISKIEFTQARLASSPEISSTNGSISEYDSENQILTWTGNDANPVIVVASASKTGALRFWGITITYGDDTGSGGNSNPVLSLVTDKFEPAANYTKREGVNWWDYAANKDNKGDSWNQFAFTGEYADGGYAGKIVVNGENLPEGGRLECKSFYPADILTLNTPPHLA